MEICPSPGYNAWNMHRSSERGLSLIAVVAFLALLAGAIAIFMLLPTEGNDSSSNESVSREALGPAVSAIAACQAACRNQYGGSGSAGFDACMRACGEGGVLREEAACPSPGPACPSPLSPVCHDGKWYCRENAPAGAAGARVFPETNNVLNVPTDAQLREGACGEPGLACESPSIPECRNGRWTCIGPASPSGVAPAPSRATGESRAR